MVAVCSVSYASYLLQRYVAPASAGLLTAVLGGMYSSTATTVVLARQGNASRRTGRASSRGPATRQIADRHRARDEHHVPAPAGHHRGLQSPAGVRGRAIPAGARVRRVRAVRRDLPAGLRASRPDRPGRRPANPLELGTAAIFAAPFIVVSLASSWAVHQFGAAGIYVLAAFVGVSDIDPFVLSLAQNGAGQVSAAWASSRSCWPRRPTTC